MYVENIIQFVVCYNYTIIDDHRIWHTNIKVKKKEKKTVQLL
jgi:hypothetical protein